MPQDSPPRHPTPMPIDVVAAVKRIEDRVMEALNNVLASIRAQVDLIAANTRPLADHVNDLDRRITRLEQAQMLSGQNALQELHDAVDVAVEEGAESSPPSTEPERTA